MKQLGAGSEIDAWCTWCRMDLGHRIVAMVGGAPKRVICLTCNREHDYRAPRGARANGPAVVVRRGGEPVVPRESKRPAPVGVRAAQKAQVEKDRYDAWARMTLGKTPDAFTRYGMDRTLELGELVLHPKFGEGYVDGVREDAKVSVMFRDGPRTLAHRSK
jgi:hypothetical protein